MACDRGKSVPCMNLSPELETVHGPVLPVPEEDICEFCEEFPFLIRF